MITVCNLSYIHPNGDPVFEDLNLVINKYQKIALVGNNGSGKSTLLDILADKCSVNKGGIQRDVEPYYVRQHFGQLDELTVAEALHVSKKLMALREIEQGHATESNMALVGDDWLLEERCYDALEQWDLHGIDLDRTFYSLSGGQKTKVLLSGILIHSPELILLDEPSNHMDKSGRQLLYQFVEETNKTLLIVSHDRTLLNLLNETFELANGKIKNYGGNYDFYAAQKAIEREALNHELQAAQKELRKAKEIERETLERKQKLDARGKKKQEKAGLPTILQNTLRNNAERSTSRLKGVHAERIDEVTQDLARVREALFEVGEIRLTLDNSDIHNGKKLFVADEVNVRIGDRLLWRTPLSFAIYSGERIAVTGNNGSGKTTLMKLLLGDLFSSTGTLHRVKARMLYIDQDYSLINDHFTVFEQAQHFNTTKLPEHEVKIRLNRFLFAKDSWDKSCAWLSGGEKMRLMLCCLIISHHAPDVIVLDEPTNNLDIENVDILTAAIKNYKGTLLLISHDQAFVKGVGIERYISLE